MNRKEKETRVNIKEKNVHYNHSSLALTRFSIENNEEKSGSNFHSRGGTTSDLSCGVNAEVVFKKKLLRLDLFCYFLPSREKSKKGY